MSIVMGLEGGDVIGNCLG